MRLNCASGLIGSTVATASSPATARRLCPWTPSPTTSTRTALSLIIDQPLHGVDFLQHPLRSDRHIAVVLTLDACCHVAQYGGDDVVPGRNHRQRRVSKQRVTRPHRVHHAVGE